MSRPHCVREKRAVDNCKPGDRLSSAAFRIWVNEKRLSTSTDGGFQIGPRERR
jgi:hypothetical protein